MSIVIYKFYILFLDVTEINKSFDYSNTPESIRWDIWKPSNILTSRNRSNMRVSMMEVDEFYWMIKNKIILTIMIWKFKICSDINAILLRSVNFTNIWKKFEMIILISRFYVFTRNLSLYEMQTWIAIFFVCHLLGWWIGIDFPVDDVDHIGKIETDCRTS